MKLIVRIAKIIVGILLIPLLYALWYEVWVLLTSQADLRSLQWFIFGLLFYLVVYLAFYKHMRFYEIFVHESTHMLVALLFLHQPKKFIVNVEEGGLAAWSNGSNFIITLAPYYLPVLTIPLLIIKAFAPPVAYAPLDFLIGFFYAFHVVSLATFELRPSQPDIKKVGWIFSFVMIGILNAIFLAIILCAVLNNYAYLPTYFKNSFFRAIEAGKTIVQWVKELLLPRLDQLRP